jgi:hypothetical protein
MKTLTGYHKSTAGNHTNLVYQPKGREAWTYLRWICDGQAKDDMVFCQGNPFSQPRFPSSPDHSRSKYYGKIEECNADAAPLFSGAPLMLQ